MYAEIHSLILSPQEEKPPAADLGTCEAATRIQV